MFEVDNNIYYCLRVWEHEDMLAGERWSWLDDDDVGRQQRRSSYSQEVHHEAAQEDDRI